MYGVVLLAALAGTAELPDCHRGGRHGGCGGGGGYGGGCGYGGYGGGCGAGGCGYAYGGYGGGGCPGGVCYGLPTATGGVLVLADAPATIVVTLPEDAKLAIDDNATTSTSGNRVFVTPSLPIGQEYHYTLKAEVMRDGKATTVEQTITVKAGEETRIELTLPATGVASR